jgi:hypothetical protein
MGNAVDTGGVPAEASLSVVNPPAFTISRLDGDLNIVSAPAHGFSSSAGSRGAV